MRVHPSWPGPAPSPSGGPRVTEPRPRPTCPACPALGPAPEPSHALLAVGPPLLTLVNFEVENLAYMLVCMQWRVSGPCSGPPGVQPWWQEAGPSGSNPCPRMQTGVCARSSEAHACRGEHTCPQGPAWCPPWGWGSAGLTPPGIGLPSRGSPLSAPPWHPHFHAQLAGQDPCPFPWLRTPGPRGGRELPRAPRHIKQKAWMTLAAPSGRLKTCVPHSPQDLLWAASFYSRFFLSYLPFYSVSGVLLLFVAVRYGSSEWQGRGHTQAAGALTVALTLRACLGCRRIQRHESGGLSDQWVGRPGLGLTGRLPLSAGDSSGGGFAATPLLRRGGGGPGPVSVVRWTWQPRASPQGPGEPLVRVDHADEPHPQGDRP